MLRKFCQIEKQNESEAKIFLEEIYGSSQDLFRLGFSHAYKLKNTKCVSISQAAGYEKDITFSVPESSNYQFLNCSPN
ncbi:hypothetical protein AYI70_g7209 [Smittium culicis]|uniref:Uncharacterized protein n=1 Tax=Smittium culicis TaxID=133412 RepID=A0A1R1XLK7_9FUNG|nr:hypothetical protein AYI70_g7209 [Smittium culicis]